MKWACIIYDPEEFAAKNINKVDFSRFEDVKCFTSYHAIVKWAENYWHDYDHVLMIYDGHWILDGIANQSFYCIKYGDKVLCHHTVSLVEKVINLTYNEVNIINILNASLNTFNEIFFKEN